MNGSFVVFDFAEVGLQDSNKDLYIELFYDGVRVSSLTYRIETYLGNSTADPAIGELCTALLKLGISFRAYAG